MLDPRNVPAGPPPRRYVRRNLHGRALVHVLPLELLALRPSVAVCVDPACDTACGLWHLSC